MIIINTSAFFKKIFTLNHVIVCILFSYSHSAYCQNDSIVKKQIILNDLTVTGKSISRNNTYTYLPNAAKNLITPLGGTDVIRYIATLPGVSQGMEGGMGFYVRGGDNGNNRIELDNIPIYGSTHLFGLFSTFSPDIVQSTTFRSGGIPVSSGDLLSSLTNIKTIDPDTNRLLMKYSVSPFMATGSVNFPINKKTGVILAVRQSLLWPEYSLIKAIGGIETEFKPQIGDIYFKVNHKINNQNQLYLSGYLSSDYFIIGISSLKFLMSWNNSNVKLNWNWKIKDNLNLQTFMYYNHFYSGQKQTYYYNEDLKDISSNLLVKTALSEEVIQSKLVFKSDLFNLTSGIEFKNQFYEPLTQSVVTSKTNSTSTFNDNYSAQSMVAFAEISLKTKQISTTFGIRENLFQIELLKKWITDLRYNITYNPIKNLGFEISYDLLSQTHHSIEGLPVGWSLDLLIPATDEFKPELANQIYIGSFWSNNKYMISGGAYYKTMKNLVSYINPIDAFGVQNANWKDGVTSGNGKSYGVEIRASRKSNKWNSELSYTLSKTTRQFDLINNGNPFPFKFDRRHIFNFNNIFIIKKTNEKEQHLNVGLTYYTGNKLTIPIGYYKGLNPPYWTLKHNSPINYTQNEMVYSRQLMSDINGFKVADYLRLDIGYSFIKINNHSTRELTFGLYNVLNRQNPYLIFYQNGSWKQLSILPILPSVEWKISF